MSQYLPKLEPTFAKKRTIEMKSPRSKSQNPKPRRILLNDEISKRYSGYHPIEALGKPLPKSHLPTLPPYKMSSHNALSHNPYPSDMYTNVSSSQAMSSLSKKESTLDEYGFVKNSHLNTKNHHLDLNRSSLRDNPVTLRSNPRHFDTE
jgi:hypothetical protein